jgi:hypothetical protein
MFREYDFTCGHMDYRLHITVSYARHMGNIKILQLAFHVVRRKDTLH